MKSARFVKFSASTAFIFFLMICFAGCGGIGGGSHNNGGGNGNGPTIVSFTAAPPSVTSGSAVTLTWKTQNATSVSIAPGLGGQPANGSVTVNPTANTTYTLTAMGSDGSSTTATAAVTVTAPAKPTITVTATPTTVAAGSFVTISWTTTNASSISFNPSITPEDQSLALPNGSASIPVQQTTTFVGTVQGAGGTATASVTVTVVPGPTIVFNAAPACVTSGQSATLAWSTTNATGVTITDQSGNSVGSFGTSGTTTVAPTTTTTYTATAAGTAGVSATANTTVTVGNCPSGGLSQIKHIIFYVQENRSFDMYFGHLKAYAANKGINLDLDTWENLNPAPVLTGLQGISHSPFHERTERTDNLTPSWNESHFDLHRSGMPKADQNGQCPATPPPTCDQTSCAMDRFMKTTNSIHNLFGTDPNGDRAIGYYDDSDLPFYYELATQFATSDRWFSPLMANTVPNRMYLFAATSFGNAFPPASATTGQFTQPTIFDNMDKAGVSWKYYYIDSSVFLTQWATWNNPQDQGRVRNIKEWFSILSQPNADDLLPSVVFIERGSATGLDEHPENNIQKGAAEAQQIITALMSSSAWKDSAFIWTFDEGGGLYDHVPPFTEVAPDSIPPQLRPGDTCSQFNESGFRLPMIVISPWVKPHFVSHVNRDNTAILKLIEARFNVAPLTARDAAQDDMEEFFDFTSPQLLIPPPLPQQPTNGVDNPNLEAHP